MKRTPTFYCESCSKVTTRMFGVVAGIETGEGMASTRTKVLGYCAAHRADVLPAYLTSLEPLGKVVLISDPPAELRPAEVRDFLAWTDRNMSFDHEAGSAAEGFNIAERCRHCGGPLSWGTGPHAADALHRDAVAWECGHCGAAGLLTRA